MEYIVKVHYKTDPADLIWSYSGKRHTNLGEATEEAVEAMKKPHINKAFVTGIGHTDRKEPESTSEMDKAIEECIDSVDKLIQATNTIDKMPVCITMGAVFATVLDDYIREKRMTVEEAVVTLHGAIQSIRKYGGKIDDKIQG